MLRFLCLAVLLLMLVGVCFADDQSCLVNTLFRSVSNLADKVKEMGNDLQNEKEERIKLQEENVELRKITAQLQADNVLLNQTSTNEREERIKLKQENVELREITAQLQADNKLLNQTSTKIDSDLQNERQERIKLQEENVELRKITAQLHIMLLNQSLTVNACCIEEKPAAHLYGSGATVALSVGTRVTYWSTSTSPPGFLRGGTVYNNGYITVPRDGLYYVYLQLWYERDAGQNYCSFWIKLNDTNNIGSVYHYQQNTDGHDESQYTGLTVMLTANDRISVTVRDSTCNCDFYTTDTAFFGAFYIG
ncbi:uncharacterized protein LOC134194940 [Corticium candelabrum]|uniref:uncharacterized protein LOC134194940 n=1 Tax=Corticium candelabrum TaxID=121492 RepID=UPI002E252C4D|nr:uncharacterized protein LOC134194940 [Corticium candelabrum]